MADIISAYRELTAYETVEMLWEAEEGVINQLIHRLMGNRRLLMMDGQIVGTTDV